jgi:hypothetical protein
MVASVPAENLSTAPVAAFLYKRPGHTRRLLASLASSPLAGETDLFLFCDAAKTAADEEAVRQVRQEARAAAGFKSVTLVERERNWGLSRSVTSAVSDLCSRFGRVIAVEDDLILAPSFLGFMNDALVRYEREERIMQVTGFQFSLRTTPSDKCVLLPLISCWGWGTWARAWAAYDASGAGAKTLEANPRLRQAFNLNGAYDYMSLLEQQRQRKVDSWGVRWYLTVFERGGLVLFPPRSLVSNEGFDGSGTHLVSLSNFALAQGSWPDSARFTYPETVAPSHEALAEIESILRAVRSPGLIARIKRRLTL